MNLFYYPVQPRPRVDSIARTLEHMSLPWFPIVPIEEFYGRFGPFPIVTSYNSVVGVRM